MKNFFGVKSSIFISLLFFVISIFLSGIKDKPDIFQLYNLKNTLNNQNVEYVNLKEGFFNFNTKEKIFYKNLNQIVVPVKNSIGDGIGSAIRINSNVWVTARHVVFDCLNVYLQSKKVEKIILTEYSDIAILIINKALNDLDRNRFDKFNETIFNFKMNREEDVISIGYPSGSPGQARLSFLGYQKMHQKGKYNLIEPVRVWVEKERYPIDLKNMGGISGGLLYSKQNGLVGVHVANSLRKGRAYSVTEYSFYKILSFLEDVENFYYDIDIFSNMKFSVFKFFKY